jgi:putative acetyltransferase
MLGEYVDAIWGWDEPARRAYRETHFDAAHTQIITVDGHDAGVPVRPGQVCRSFGQNR